MARRALYEAGTRRQTKRSRSARRGAESNSSLPKLTRPDPSRIYPRSRLFDLLDHTRAEHPVIWISAPAGSGKTSLAASYLSARGLPVLWYQVDSGDEDIASFFYYMGIAVRQVAPRYRRALPVLTPEYLGDLSTFTRNFFREAFRRLPDAAAIVLDNYQDASEDCALHDVLRVAAGEIPEGMHLLVLSRAEPPSALARLRLCERAACLDWSTMQLTPEETRGICVMRIGEDKLASNVLVALHERAQGWAAGVVLLLEQLGGANLSDLSKLPTGQKVLFDYFAGEVLDRMNPQVREFLLGTAVLPKVSTAAARSLTGIANAKEILEDLTARNYFTVRLAGQDSDTYQYHPLFREFLLDSAERGHGRDRLDSVRSSAGQVLIGEGQVDEGMDLLIAAQSWGPAIEQIRQQAPMQLRSGRWQTLGQWIAALPQETVTEDPWLTFWRAHAEMPRDLVEAREDFRRAYLQFKEQGDPAGCYLAWSGAVDTFTYVWGEFVPLDFWMDEMEALRKRFPAYPSLEIEAQVTCGMIGAAIWRRADHPMMREWVAAGIALLDKPIDRVVKVRTGHLALLYLLWWGNRITDAQAVLEKIRVVADAPEISILAKLLWNVMHAASSSFEGAADRAISTADEGLRLAAEFGVHHVDFLLYAQVVYAQLAKFDAEGAAENIKNIEALMPYTEAFDFAHYHYLATWVLLGLGRPLPALEHIRKASDAAVRSGASCYPAFAALTTAQVLYECGRAEEAMEAIEPAREWAARIDAAFIEIHCQFLKGIYASDRQDRAACAAAIAAALTLWKERGYAMVPWIGWRKPLLTRLFHQALILGIEPDFVCSLIRSYRLSPPSNAPVPEAWPFPVKLRTLGGFSVEADGKRMARALVHRRPLELLQALVALGGRDVDETRLADALWPEAEGDAAHQNLKMNTHRLRALLPEGTLLWSDGKLSLNDQQTWIDAWALERELDSLDRTTPESSPAAQPPIDRVFGLYRGDFLPESATSWAPAMRERLRNKTLRLVTKVADALSKSEPAVAVPIYERAIELDPLRESLYQGQMRCYRQLRQPAEGLRLYRRCHDVLRRELGVAPAPETEALRQDLMAGR